MIIAIDFDGVIVMDEYPAIGEPLPHMVEIMRSLFDRHTLIINTCRMGTYATDAIRALGVMDVPFHFFNQNSPEQTEKYGSECRKISADLYLDDKNLGGFPGWETVFNEVLRTEQ